MRIHNSRPTGLRSISRVALAALLLLSACATTSKTPTHDTVPPGSPKGYVEFYCDQCIAGWAVSKAGNGDKESRLGELLLGRKLEDSMNDPSRMKILRIAHPPGTVDLVVELLPFTRAATLVNPSVGASKHIQVTVAQDQVTPVRVDFTQESRRSFSWAMRQGKALPLGSDPESTQALTSALNDRDWETRWYATRLLGESAAALPESAGARLKELAGKEEYERCLTSASVEECAALRDAAGKTLMKGRTD